MIVWAVQVGDDTFVRSAYGAENPWYRHAVASGIGKIMVSGVEKEVKFVALVPEDARHETIHAAYHAKYDHHLAAHVDPVTEMGGTAATLRLIAR